MQSGSQREVGYSLVFMLIRKGDVIIFPQTVCALVKGKPQPVIPWGTYQVFCQTESGYYLWGWSLSKTNMELYGPVDLTELEWAWHPKAHRES